MVAVHLAPLMTGQPECIENGSCVPSTFVEKKRRADPFLGLKETGGSEDLGLSELRRLGAGVGNEVRSWQCEKGPRLSASCGSIHLDPFKKAVSPPSSTYRAERSSQRLSRLS